MGTCSAKLMNEGGGAQSGVASRVASEVQGAGTAQVITPMQQEIVRTPSFGLKRAGERGANNNGGDRMVGSVEGKRSPACCVVTERNAERGRVVVRGPSWQWEDQDGGTGCTGTLMQDEDGGWWRVKWEGEWWRANSYRVGGDGAYDLAFALHDCPCRRPSLPQPESMPLVYNNRTKKYGPPSATDMSPPAVEVTSTPFSATVKTVALDASLEAGTGRTLSGAPARVLPDGAAVRSIHQPDGFTPRSYPGMESQAYQDGGGEARDHSVGMPQRVESLGNELTMGTKGFRVGGLTPRGVGTSPTLKPRPGPSSGDFGAALTPRGWGWGGEEGGGGFVRQAATGMMDGSRSGFKSNFIYTPQSQREAMPAGVITPSSGGHGHVMMTPSTPAPAGGHSSYIVRSPIPAGEEEMARQRELARQKEREVALERERARELELAREREMVQRERERDRERMREVEMERERVRQGQELEERVLREKERAKKEEKERQRLKERVRVRILYLCSLSPSPPRRLSVPWRPPPPRFVLLTFPRAGLRLPTPPASTLSGCTQRAGASIQAVASRRREEEEGKRSAAGEGSRGSPSIPLPPPSLHTAYGLG